MRETQQLNVIHDHGLDSRLKTILLKTLLEKLGKFEDRLYIRCVCLCVSCSVVSDSLRPHGL